MGFLPTHPDRKLFVSWVKHTSRSASYAQAIGAECYYCYSGASWGPFKYIPRTLEMTALLLRKRPGVVFCMNPPPFVALTAWAYSRVFRARYVLDSHTDAFDGRFWPRFRPLHAFLARRAACSTVTNAALAGQVEEMGGRAVVVTDIPYEMPAGNFVVPQDRFTVVFICAYAPDEPVLEVFEAARQLPDVLFYVTGNDKRAGDDVRRARPDNVILTGYLSNDAYRGLIRGASALMALTTRNHTMQRGGSEAVTVGRPLITSDWPMLRETFSRGTVHVDNTAEGIRRGIEEVRANLDRYREEMRQLKEERQSRWEESRRNIEAALGLRLTTGD